ncbi:DUF4362 domain-containing protein [Planococcus shenhongbingii]|uniref:DUF4362 domain-containing protein n=1 Tax=Planococcus shenhongbingii TaxID=3058398 RepID=A0ABT8NDK8_9BACL|nr:DUF4362 domain-containing protein [Planococcus sp. N017]MDN7245984.1 DUF4362 domain-containing protein [Planococcus sp. N017]
MGNLKKVLLIGFALLAAGCQSSAEDPGNPDANDDDSSGRDRIFNRHGEIENLDRFERFLSYVDQGQEDAIRIVNYTTEGDPIYQDLTFNGEMIQYVYDSSKDDYGSGEVMELTCTSIEKVEQADFTDYVLAECDSDMNPLILSIGK